MKNPSSNKSFIVSLGEAIDLVFQMISHSVRTENERQTMLSSELKHVLNNPVDRKKIDDAVVYLQKHSVEKSKEVELSDHSKMTISID